MENSGKIFFDHDSVQWYVAIESRWIGPLSASDIYEKILNHELTWAHYVFKQGQSGWKRICDVKTFQAMVPHQPDKKTQKEIQQAEKPKIKRASETPRRKTSERPPPPVEKKKWYLYYNESQFGPFSESEIQRFLKIGKIHMKVHAWKEGMSNWEKIERIEVFSHKPKPPHPEAVRAEQRGSPRKPLVAKILMSNEQSVIVGVCRDISIGGLQVLTEKAPGKVGAKLRMNISPSSPEAQFEPFVAEGVIVRILEDQRGFSFRFERLTDRARQSIESYVQFAK